MRSSGVRGLLVYCADYRCSHCIAISGDRWPDDVRVSDLEPRTTPFAYRKTTQSRQHCSAKLGFPAASLARGDAAIDGPGALSWAAGAIFQVADTTTNNGTARWLSGVVSNSLNPSKIGG